MANRVRLAVAIVVALLLAWATFSHAMVTVTHARNPRMALRFDGDDPVALVRAAQAELAAATTRQNARRALEAARLSIRGYALNARAFQMLGMMDEGASTEEAVAKLMTFSNRLSRHDLSTQLALIEQAVRRNDVAAALDHYDITLRRSPASETLLYPVLTKALDEPAIRRRFIPYIQDPPPWMQRFLSYALANTTNPAALAQLSAEAGGFPKGPEYEDFDGFLIRRFADVNDYAGALRYYGRLGGDSERVLTSAEMTASSTDQRYAPITWQPFVLEGMNASFVTASGDQLHLEAQLESTFSGPIARKVLKLPPGTYSFSADQRSEDPGPVSRLAWRIGCPGTVPTLLFSRTEPLAQSATVRGTFAVTSGCPIQVITVEGTAGTETGGLDVSIGPVRIARN